MHCENCPGHFGSQYFGVVGEVKVAVQVKSQPAEGLGHGYGSVKAG